MAALLTALCLMPIAAPAQTTLNPDISVIGDTRATWTSDKADVERRQINLHMHEVELALQGYLNPYAKDDIFGSWDEGEAARIEEAYVTFTRGLPLGLAVKAGQYRLEFGKINPLHPHAYPFIVSPLANNEFMGADGWRDVGVHVSAALPTGNVETNLSADVLKGDFITEPPGFGAAAVAAADAAGARPHRRAFAGRWNSFFTLGEFTSLSVGAGGLTGVPATGERRWVGGADLKLHWRPDRYRSFTGVAEWIVNRQPDSVGVNLSRQGLFAYGDYQFRQRFNIGGLGDWTQAANNRTQKFWRLGGFIGFAPAEETSLLRLLVDYRRDIAASSGFWTVTTQLIFSLGPHKPHSF